MHLCRIHIKYVIFFSQLLFPKKCNFLIHSILQFPLGHEASLTSVHDRVPSDFRLPVVPRGLEALGEAEAEVLEVAFAHQGLGGAGGDERALDGQDHRRARVKINAVVGLAERQGDGGHRGGGGYYGLQRKEQYVDIE